MTSTAGVLLKVTLTPANCHDRRQLLPLVLLEFPRIGGRRGRPRDRPHSVTAEKGCDASPDRELMSSGGIDPHIPRRGSPEPSPLRSVRWPIERTLSWHKQLRRLRSRRVRPDTIHEAFLQLGCTLSAKRFLTA